MTDQSVVTIGSQDAAESSYRRKLEGLRQAGVDPYSSTFRKDVQAAELQTRYIALAPGEQTEDCVRVSGRIKAMRNGGTFVDLQDATGKIQVFAGGELASALGGGVLSYLDLGDPIGVEGRVRRTARGELTVDAVQVSLLGKTLRPMPDKQRGLTDVDARFRQRHLDLMANDTTRRVLKSRSLIVREFRRVLEDRDFIEVETPLLHPKLGGGTTKVRPFTTHHNALDMQLYMRVSPELYIKRLLIGGLADRIFEINRNFRNEGLSTRHNPEYTALEIFQSYADYEDMIELVEAILARVAAAVSREFPAPEQTFDAPLPRREMLDLVAETTGVDFRTIAEDAAARAAARRLEVDLAGHETWGQVVQKVFDAHVGDQLQGPIHVLFPPRDVSPLARAHLGDGRLAQRFETFINGYVVANGCSELTDPDDQRRQFEARMRSHLEGGYESQLMDEEYLGALECGMFPTAGVGIAVDRVTMVMTGAPSIREVIAFPTLRAKG